MSKSILIVIYNANLNEGVGARRWLKFSNELVTIGFDVHLLTTKANSDINPKVKLHFFKSNYYQILDKQPKTFIEKLKYRIAYFKQKFKSNSLIFDKSVRDKKVIESCISKIITSNKIQNVIVSGAPFSLLYFAAKLNRVLNFNLICDLRDPWTWGSGYGMGSLSKSRKEIEISKENYVIENSNKIFAASDDILNYLNNTYPNYAKKFKLVRNGFIPTNIIPNQKGNSNPVRISHIGTVGNGTRKYWEPFFKKIEDLPEFELDFFGNSNIEIENWIKQYNPKKINLKPKVKEIFLFTELANYDAFVIFKKDNFENSFPSKFFDYIQFKRPIIVFTKPGTVSQLIIENNIGFVFNESFDLLEANDLKSKILNHNFTFNPELFSIKNSISLITQELI